MKLAETAVDANTAATQLAALDGGIVGILSPAKLSDHTSSLVLRSPFGARIFESGTTSFARAGAERDFGITDFDQGYSFQGGSLSLGNAIVRNPDVPGYETVCYYAVWEGDSYSLCTHLYRAGYERLLALLDLVRLEETSTGVVLAPKNADVSPILRTAHHAPDVIVQAHDLGILEIRRSTPETRAFLPSWQGATTEGGELFAGEEGSFVLATDSAIVRIDTAGVVASVEEALPLISELQVSWEPSP